VRGSENLADRLAALGVPVVVPVIVRQKSRA
jgi:hypothetical protein